MSNDDNIFRYTDVVEPNVYQEPRTATQPFVVVYEEGVNLFPCLAMGDTILTFSDRATAERYARDEAEECKLPHYVLGAVSISSCPPPVKASTRALV